MKDLFSERKNIWLAQNLFPATNQRQSPVYSYKKHGARPRPGITMKVQVITNNVGGLYTEEKLQADQYAGPSQEGALTSHAFAAPRRDMPTAGSPPSGPGGWPP